MVQQTLPPPVPVIPAPDQEEGMTLIEHLIELRTRLVKAGIAIIAGLCVGAFAVLGPFDLLSYIIERFANTGKPYPAVQAVAATETFTSYMTLALTIGVILAMPVIVYQLIAFIAPALTSKEKRYLFIALPFVTGCFLAGVVFGWFITVPAALKFLLNFGDPTEIQIQPALSDFISIVTTLLLINGVVFEMPVIIYVLALLGVVTPQKLAKYRKYAFLANVIIAAIITPTGDPINLLLLAIPMHLLYELGIVLARFTPKREPKVV